MKLAVMADLHVDLLPGGKRRLEQFYAAAQREKADLVINLGDFASPKRENEWVADLWKACPQPHLMVMGNHDMDQSDKAGWLQFYDMKRGYDTLVQDGLQFIMLDTNHFNFGGICYDYAYQNYFEREREFLGAAQLEWLNNVLERAEYPCILLSHEGLEHTGDRDAVMPILNKYREKIVVCINGHNHVDGLTVQDKIHFLDVVSMSQQWVGESEKMLTVQDCEGFLTEDDFKQYDCLKYVAPYRDTMYEFVEIDTEKKEVTVWGTKSGFVGNSPKERGHSGEVNGIALPTEVQKKSFRWGL